MENAFGFLQTVPCWATIVLCIVLALGLGFFGSPLWLWVLAILVVMAGLNAPVMAIGIVFAISLIFLIKPIRTNLISKAIAALFKKFEFIPKISETERTALDAGVVWVEKDLFSGKPDFAALMKEPYPQLTAEEQAFVNGPVEELCRLINPWKVFKNQDMEGAAWEFVKREKFLGMIIPKEYGGLGFSALCHSEVIQKISSRSLPVSIQVMVPNSLGPAELLVHYGTEEQKKHYLPRLAAGLEIPCFGLTEPLAGSDAGAINASGIVFRGPDGKLAIRLNWNKRWISLAAISTVLGLAFKVRDPENLLGRGEDLGITCALVPANTPGVVLGRRHNPLMIAFYNCPTQGKDVVIPMDAVVGGAEGVGKGWGMLMECLAAGRGISLPSQSTGGAKLSYLVTSAHSVIRRQFGVSIGKFEGIEEPLARIGSMTYALEAMRRFTLGALDKGLKPPVVTAIQKYYSTEFGRKVINDAMDIMGGAGISLGPRNLLAETYMATPIGITVEGANIMTRTLIVFGQGALRAHPFAYAEVKALEANDMPGFDRAFFGHIGHVVRNLCRSIVLSISRAHLATAPDCHPEMRKYFRRLQWASASFAIMADVAMGSLGGALKLREKITGRFADILAHMYVATSVLRRFEADGRRKEDLPFVHFVLKYCMVSIQHGFDGLFSNIKIPGLRWLFRDVLGAWSRINTFQNEASDGWSHLIATAMMEDMPQRLRLCEGIYIPKERDQQIGRLEYALDIAHRADAAEKKIRAAIKAKTLPKKKTFMLIEEAAKANVITAAERALLLEADAVRLDAIMVDDFSEEEFHGKA